MITMMMMMMMMDNHDDHDNDADDRSFLTSVLQGYRRKQGLEGRTRRPK